MSPRGDPASSGDPRGPDPEASQRALRRGTVRSVRSAGISSVLVNVIAGLQLFAVARLLQPRDVGLMGMVVVVVSFASLLSDLSIGNSVIHFRDLDDRMLSTLHWASMIVGGSLTLLVLVMSGQLAVLFNDPDLRGPLQQIAPIFILTSAGQLSTGLLERDLRFRSLGTIDTVAAAATAVVTVALAALGAGVTALVVGALCGAGVRSLGSILTMQRTWRPSFVFAPLEAKEYLVFGAGRSLQRVVNYISANVDFFLIGRLVGSQSLGSYAMAYNIANLASSRINAVLSRVFLPVFASVQTDAQAIRSGFMRFQRVSAAINFPLLAALIVASPLVPRVLGEEWTTTARILPVIAVVGITRSIMGTVGPLIIALGRIRRGITWSVAVLFLQVPAIYVGVRRGGALGAAIAFAAVQILLLVPNYRFLVRSLVGPSLRTYVRSMLPGLASALAMAATFLATGGIVSNLLEGWPLWTMQALLGAAVVVVVTLRTNAELISLVKDAMR